MLVNTVVHDLYRTTLRVLIAAAPLLIWYPAWGLTDGIWQSVLLGMRPTGPNYALAYSAWPTVALVGPAWVMAGVLLLRGFGLVRTITAAAAVIGLACASLLTGWPEAAHLISLRPATPWIDVFRAAHLNIGFASAMGFLACGFGARTLLGKPLRAPGVKPSERAKTDNFGHADWMSIKEAMTLFPALSNPDSRGGVVIGEAYRVDQDSVSSNAFNPRDRATWGKGGKAPLLVFDLGWGGTHGLVFAGSGSYKTVST